MANPVGTYYRATIDEVCAKCQAVVEDFVMYDDGSAKCLNCAASQDVSE